jgi:hypothetical protein
MGRNGMRVTWEASRSGDVAGYHVYRAPVAPKSYWNETFNPADVQGTLERMTKEPLRDALFVDTAARVEGEACEYAWPGSYAYAVRAVNAWGLEGGYGPVAPALPDPPGTVRVIPWCDGRRLVLWSPGRGGTADGYFVMRQDDWNRGYAFRWHGAPVAGCTFWDDQEFPRADRRRYYVYGVDTEGVVGIPSSGAWSHGFP